MLVVDAGAVVGVLLRVAVADEIRAALSADGHDPHCPELPEAETLNVMRKHVARGAVL